MFMESWICVVYERNVGYSRCLLLIWGGNNIVRCVDCFWYLFNDMLFDLILLRKLYECFWNVVKKLWYIMVYVI